MAILFFPLSPTHLNFANANTHTHTHAHSHTHTHTQTHTHTDVVLPDVLPSCEYHPSYVSVHEVTRYTGFKEVLAAVCYPDDHTWHKNGRHESEGNPIIEEEVCWGLGLGGNE